MWRWNPPPGGQVEGPDWLYLRPPGGFGDHLMLSAVIEGVRSAHPGLKVSVAASHPELFKNNPRVDHLFHKRWLRLARPEVAGRYREVGYRGPEARRSPGASHMIEDMYAALGLPLDKRPRRPRLYLTDRETDWGRRVLEASPRPRVAVVGYGKPEAWFPNKVYPAEQWQELASLMKRLPGERVQLGAASDGPLLGDARDLRGAGYRRTAALLQECDLLVTHPGGLMHLAAAVGTPAVVMFGAAEHPDVSGYPTNRNLYVQVECGPCWLQTPCSHLSCMRELTPARVFSEIEAALGCPVRLAA